MFKRLWLAAFVGLLTTALIVQHTGHKADLWFALALSTLLVPLLRAIFERPTVSPSVDTPRE